MTIRYLNKTLQTKYLKIIVISMLFPTLFVGACLYYLIFTVMADSIVLPDMIARDLLPVIRTINYILAVGLPVVFIILVAWARALSIRFIDPLERLEEDLKKIDEGDYSVRLEIQQDHDLAPIAGVINDLVEKIDRKEGM